MVVGVCILFIAGACDRVGFNLPGLLIYCFYRVALVCYHPFVLPCLRSLSQL